MRTSLLLAWRLHRAELLALAVAAGGLSLIAVLASGAMDAIVAGCRAAEAVVSPCGGLRESGVIYDNDLHGVAGLVRQALAILPFAAGVILGVSVTAREIEHHTAQLSWPLARSRGRWLMLRFLPVALIGTIVLAAPAMAGEVLARAFYPALDPATNFESYGTRGPLLVLRFLPASLLGAIVGAWIGRQLPAVLVAGLLVGAAGIGLMQVPPYLAEPVERTANFEEPIDHLGDLYVRSAYRDAAGNWMREEDAWAILATEFEDEPGSDAPEEVLFAILRERYHDVVLREGLALTAVCSLLGGLLLVVVRRRRPG